MLCALLVAPHRLQALFPGTHHSLKILALPVQINFPENSCGAVIGNKKLELLQFHFHTPSEHALNGKRYAMEAHLVHREVGTEELTVLGVMIMRGKGAASNPALRKALDLAPAKGGKVWLHLLR
jgi:carbonic anhydrase